MRSLSTLALGGLVLTLWPLSARAQERTLADVVRRALEVHPSVEAARDATEAAGAGVSAARAAWLPGLSLQGAATRFQEPMVVAPIHAFDITQAPDFDRTLIQGTVGLRYTIFDGGKRGAEVARARALENVSRAQLSEAEAALVERTAQAYLQLLTARDVVEAQDRREAALEAERARVQRFLDEGTAPRLDLLRAEAELAQVRADGEGARRALELAAATLGRLLDEPAQELRDAPLADPGLPGAARPADSLVDASPPVRAAVRQARAARAELDVARAAWLPELDAAAGYNLYAGGSTDANGEWQGGLRISYPLFTGGARRSAVDAANARSRASEARIDIAREQVALAADAARTGEDEARARMTALEAAVDRYEELARVERLALDEGSGVQTDFLRAEAGLYQARAGLAEARRSVLLSRIAWARAVGTLDMNWIERLLEDQP